MFLLPCFSWCTLDPETFGPNPFHLHPFPNNKDMFFSLGSTPKVKYLMSDHILSRLFGNNLKQLKERVICHSRQIQSKIKLVFLYRLIRSIRHQGVQLTSQQTCFSVRMLNDNAFIYIYEKITFQVLLIALTATKVSFFLVLFFTVEF